MKSILASFHYKPLLLTGVAVGWFEVAYVPQPMRLLFLVGCMMVDLISGLFRSWKEGKATYPDGLQKTIIKVTRYCCCVIACWFLANVLGALSPIKVDYTFFVHGCIGFLSLIEIYSILDNVYWMDPDGELSRYFIGPILRFLKGRLKDNPISHLPPPDESPNENSEDHESVPK